MTYKYNGVEVSKQMYDELRGIRKDLQETLRMG